MNLTCAHCSAPFQVDASRLRHGRGKHCSPTCQYAARRARPNSQVSRECIGCGVEFTRAPSQLRQNGAGKFCTRACRDKHWRGDKNPVWRDGSGVYKRGSHWHAIRRRIVARDKCCQHCGATKRLHVHHKIPFRMWRTPEDANRDFNLIALCPPCHRRADAAHRWIGNFQAA